MYKYKVTNMEKFTKQILLWLALLGCTMSTMAANVVTQQTINTVTYDLYDNYTARPWSVNASGPVTILSQITYAGKTYYVTEIDSSAFKNCIRISSVTISEGITSIGKDAFRGCTGMTSVSIPSTVPIIGMSAFYGCTGLISVTIPEGVTSIAHSAFSACTGLKSVTIPEGVTFIGALAFAGCSGLTSLTIPESVTSISSNAFSGCDGLNSVTTNTNANLSYASICFIKDGITYQVLNKNTVAVVANNYNYSGEVVIPEYVSFGNTFITSIDANAFSYCSDLTAVTIPNSITSIGNETFSYCTNLTKVTLNSNAIVSASYAMNINLCTKFGTQVTEYILGENVTAIGRFAFYHCDGLTSVTIPEGVTSIGEYAFLQCSNVQEFIFESETPPTFEPSVFTETSCPIYVPNASAVTAYKEAANMSEYASRIQVKPIEVDGVRYQMQEDGTFAIVANNYSGEFVIPSSIEYNGVATAVTSIGKNAFNGCTGLTAVTIPSSITSMGTNAFSGCTSLTKVTLNSNAIASKTYTNDSNLKHIFGDQVTEFVLGEDVTAIGESAFEGCTGLTSVTIPESVTSIGGYAFYGNTGLVSVTIPSSVTSIGERAFQACSNVQEFVFEGETPPTFGTFVFGSSCPIYVPTALAITAYKNAANMSTYASRVQMRPIEVDGVKYQLQEDGTFAVSRNNYSAEIVIPSSINYNGVATAVTAINSNAFSNCTGLTAVTIPEGVTTIGQSAFEGCTGLTSVTIPESVTSIESSAFSGCTNLTKVILNSNAVASKTYTSSSNLKNIFGTQITEYVLGEDVTAIGNYAFYGCTGLTSVTIPESVTSIGSNAFSSCSKVQEFVFEGETPPTFGSSAFYNTGSGPIYVPTASAVTAYKAATNMSSYASRVTIMPTYVVVDGIKYQLQEDGTFAVVANSYSGEVVIPSSINYNGEATAVTAINTNAFSNCTDLTAVTIPSSIASIAADAFSGCTNLTKVTLNSNAIASKTYTSDSNLKHIFGDQVTEFVLGEGVTAIGDFAFLGNTGLVSVTISEGVTSIGRAVFSGCTNLTKVTLNSDAIASNSNLKNIFGSQVTEYVLGEGVTAIGYHAFYGNTGLVSVTISEGVTSIGNEAFRGCTGLTSVTIPSSVTSIGERVFYGCTGLTSVTIPESVTSIGEWAFYGCTGLTSVTIPNSVTSIGNYAFSSCTGLTSVTIPNSVTSIGNYAFYSCTGLTSVTISEGVTSIGENAFYSCSNVQEFVFEGETPPTFGTFVFGSSCPIYVPTALAITAYKNAANMSNYASRVKVRPIEVDGIRYRIKDDGTSAVMAKNYSGDIVIPSSVEYNGVEIPVTSIESSAFYNCDGLTSITINNDADFSSADLYFIIDGIRYKVLNKNSVAVAYYPCSDEAVIPETVTFGNTFDVTSIDGSAFSGCTGLTSVTIPSSITSIATNTFSGCTNLTKVTLNSNAVASYNSYNTYNFNFYTIFGFQVTEYVLGEDVTAIGNYAFYGCTGLTSVTIPEGVTSIGNSAFYNCKKLTSIIIPESVRSIGNYAFYGCSNVQEFIFEGETPPTFGSSAFYNTGSGPIYVPTAEAVTAYKAAANMSSYASRVKVKPVYTISVVANNDEYGTVSGSGTYDALITPAITISATAAEQYGFAYWNEDGNTEATRTITLTGDATYTAVFKRLITVSNIAVADKVYDGTTTAIVTYESAGVVENDDVTIEATANFADKKIGEGKAVTVNFELGGEDADNYTINAETAELKASITAKTVAISEIAAENKEYDGTTMATVSYSATGVVENDDVTIEPTAEFEDKNVGEDIAVTYSFAISGDDADNYVLSVENTELKANITAKAIAISNIVAENKEYDGSAAATGSFTYDESAVLEGESVTIGYEASFADKNVGEDKTVTFTFSLSGDDKDNYALASKTATATANITTKSITISELAVENKEYDGNTAATVTYTVNGVVENDDVTIELTAEFADENVGEDKAVTYSFAKSGDDADNYELSVENAELKANITAKSIAVSEIVAENKEYDGSATATGSFTYDESAVLDGESVTIGYEAAFADKNVGADKTVTFTFSLSGDDMDNYALASETATATANITTKSITISEITAENKEYDGVTAATVTYTANGVVENDDVTIEPTAEFADEKVGDDKAVTYSFAKSGEDADNYTLSVETVDLKANITAKEISINEIVVNDKEYDGTTTATATFTTVGAIENEDVAVNYTATFGDKNAEENKTVSLTFELAGEDIANYVLASSTATATAEITAKPIAVSNIAADNKIFDGETTATLAFELDGVLENDEVEVSYTANFADENVGDNKAVTFNFAKSGADEANYELAVEATEPKAAITAYTSVEVTITENSGTETYDGTEKTVTGYAVEINSELYKESDFAFNGTAEVKGTNAGEYEMNIVASDFENTNTNFADVKFNVVDGKLTIEKSAETPNMPEVTAETRLLNVTDVALPEGWAWADETIVLEEGENSAVANYVGDDADNYTIKSVTITITRLPCLHDGEYTVVDAQEATCTADGYTGDHKCSICGAIFEQGSVIPAKGHNAGEPVIENYIAPTCKEAGSVDTVYYCTIDGDLISRETHVLPVVDHVPGKKVAENYVPATITTEGAVDSVVYCVIGGEELSREHFVLPVLDHEHIAGEPTEENRVEPTCLIDGSVDTVVYCTVIGEELSREHFVLPALGHTAGEAVVENYTAPTCTEAGTVDTVYYCTIDNEEISRETYVLEAKGHQPSEKVAKNYVAPTCLVAGSVDSVVTCTVCGEILSEEHFVLPALGHTAGEAVVENYTAPTCTEAGTVDTLYYCTIDGELISKETYELPATGHKPSEKVAVNYVPATTTTEGSVDSVITCTVCGEVLYSEHFVLPILDHEHIAGAPIEENRVEPTCLLDGSADTVVYCTVNGEELNREHYVLPALGHKPSEKVAKNYVAPTCLVAGSVDSVITCTICGEVLSEEHFDLPATGHIAGEPVVENHTAPTCTTTGTVDTVYYCTVDGDLISRETHVLPMLEHVPGEKVAENYVAPTFTSVGSVDSVVYCTIGGEELSRETFELPMLQKAVEKIEILSMPKTEYVVGEDIDITGAKISVTFNDGSVEEIDLTNEMLSGFDNTLVAEQDITVTYLTFTTTIHVTVNEKTAVSDIATDATSIYAYGHTIVVETTLMGDIIVNDVNGRIVAKSQSNGDRTEIYVPKVGAYAVRIGTVSQKVVIR